MLHFFPERVTSTEVSQLYSSISHFLRFFYRLLIFCSLFLIALCFWQFLKIENEQKKKQFLWIKQNAWTTFFCVEIMNSIGQVEGKLGHVVQIDLNVSIQKLNWIAWPKSPLLGERRKEANYMVPTFANLALFALGSFSLPAEQIMLRSLFIFSSCSLCGRIRKKQNSKCQGANDLKIDIT